MTKAHHQALIFLYSNPGWQYLHIIGQRSTTLDFLVSKGYLEKRGNDADYRSLEYRMKPEGKI